MNRWYLKCMFCERPMAVNLEEGDSVEVVAQAPCPLCGEKELRVMGKVEKTNIVRPGSKAACDLRCTSAVGPKCDCICNNENHGTHRLVRYNKVVCKLEVVEKDLLNNNEEYLARIRRMAAAKVDIKRRVVAFLEWKYREIREKWAQNVYMSYEEGREYEKYREIARRIDKVEDLKSIQRKINTLTHLIPTIGDNLDYIEAVGLSRGLVK